MKFRNRIYYLFETFLLVFVLISTNFGQTVLKTNKQDLDEYVDLVSPKGTEIFFDNEIIEIKWKSNNVEKINIYFLNKQDSIVSSVTKLSAESEIYYFKKINELPRHFRIKIVASDNPSVNNISPFYFEKKSDIIFLKKDQQRESNSSNPVLKIMPLGNSITEGYTVPIPTDRNGYRKPLKEKLENYGLNFDFVGSLTNGSFADNQHEGHGGWHARHWYPNYNYDLNSHLYSFLEMNPPDIILLHIGTNDIGEYYDSRNDNTIDTTVADISALLDTIYLFDPNIKVILAKITNREDNADSPSINETLETSAFNNALEIMTNNRIANGDNLTLVDMENALTYPDDLSDGVHPDSIGYEKMSQVWFEAIINIMPKVSVKIFLEGAYKNNIMTTDLNQQNLLPLNQPFNKLPWNYAGTESVNSIPADVVDWILVSLRTSPNSSSIVTKKAGFIKKDGTIVDIDGISPLTFSTNEGNYFITVDHRNHLPVMSAQKVTITN